MTSATKTVTSDGKNDSQAPSLTGSGGRRGVLVVVAHELPAALGRPVRAAGVGAAGSAGAALGFGVASVINSGRAGDFRSF